MIILNYQNNNIDYEEVDKNDRFFNQVYLLYKSKYYRPIQDNLLVLLENYDFSVNIHKRIVMYNNYRNKYFLFIEYK